MRAETIDAVSVTGGHLGASLGVVELTVALHAVFDTPRRPADLGRRPPGLPAQDPDRPPRPHPHAAPGRRPVRLHPARGERVRPVRRRALLDLDLRRPRHGGGATTCSGATTPRDRGDRRRRDERRHGLRGDEQRRRAALAPDRHPQRQRHVDRAAGRRDERLPRAAAVGAQLPQPARPRRADGQAAARAASSAPPARRGVRPRHPDRRHAVRGAGLLLCRPDRRAQPRPPAARAAQRARRRGHGPDPAARRHPEGPGLRAGRSLGRQASTRVSKFDVLTGEQAKAPPGRRATPGCSPTR